MTDQFHDIIPGSSIHEVYEDSRKDYEYIQSVAQSVQEDALSHIIEDKKDCYTVFNASGWKDVYKRQGFGENDPEEVLELMQEYGISDRLTFSNALLRQ